MQSKTFSWNFNEMVWQSNDLKLEYISFVKKLNIELACPILIPKSGKDPSEYPLFPLLYSSSEKELFFAISYKYFSFPHPSLIPVKSSINQKTFAIVLARLISDFHN